MYYDEEMGLGFNSMSERRKIKLWHELKRGALHPIEGFERYTILPNGTVMNIDRATEVRPARTRARFIISLVDDLSERKTLSLARLIAFHYVPLPPDFDDQYYDVVPKDGNNFNVHPENLQWVPRWKIRMKEGNYDMDI